MLQSKFSNEPNKIVDLDNLSKTLKTTEKSHQFNLKVNTQTIKHTSTPISIKHSKILTHTHTNP